MIRQLYLDQRRLSSGDCLPRGLEGGLRRDMLQGRCLRMRDQDNTGAKVLTTTTTAETVPSMPLANGGGGGGGGGEDDMISAMFAASGQQWAAYRRMQGGMRIYKTNTGNTRPRPNTANLPDHPPPAGYVCYRCGERGHWIQLCPDTG